jgi:hypothetical protein
VIRVSQISGALPSPVPTRRKLDHAPFNEEDSPAIEKSFGKIEREVEKSHVDRVTRSLFPHETCDGNSGQGTGPSRWTGGASTTLGDDQSSVMKQILRQPKFRLKLKESGSLMRLCR